MSDAGGNVVAKSSSEVKEKETTKADYFKRHDVINMFEEMITVLLEDKVSYISHFTGVKGGAIFGLFSAIFCYFGVLSHTSNLRYFSYE